MKFFLFFLFSAFLGFSSWNVCAQVNRSVSTTVSRSTGEQRSVPRQRNQESKVDKNTTASVIDINSTELDPDASWMRIIYRELDLNDEKNAPLYYPEEMIYGQENLFRLILRLLAEGKIQGYEYLDGREIFTTEFSINIKETLDRFHIPYNTTDGNPGNGALVIDELDVPSSEVLSYYIIERWQFDNVQGHTKSEVLAICPVLHRTGDFGVEAVKYPMFWITASSLKPYLTKTAIFVDDFDNTARYTIDDYFAMNMYEGDIYKTRNVRNKSMMQLYPDADERKHASDSINSRLVTFDKQLWVPSREEVMEARKAKDTKEKELGEIPERSQTKESSRKLSRTSRGSKDSGSSSAAMRSVRDRKR